MGRLEEELVPHRPLVELIVERIQLRRRAMQNRSGRLVLLGEFCELGPEPLID